MPKHPNPRATRKTKERLQKLKRINRQEDVPECPSIEDFSAKGENLPETVDINPYEHELSDSEPEHDNKNGMAVINHHDVSTAISSSSSSPTFSTLRSTSSQPTSGMASSLSDSNLTAQRAKDAKSARELVDLSRPNDSLLEIRATFDQSIANRENAALRDHKKNDLIRLESDGSQSAVFTDVHAQAADFHSFVEASENQSLSKIAYIGGEILSKLVLFTLSVLRYLTNHPTPVAVLIGLISVYFIIVYLELSVATFIEMSMQFMWPTAHILLRGTERLLKLCGNFLGQVDDLGQAVYCDLAHVWCRRFNLMCEDRCSFVEMVVDRMRA